MLSGGSEPRVTRTESALAVPPDARANSSVDAAVPAAPRGGYESCSGRGCGGPRMLHIVDERVVP